MDLVSRLLEFWRVHQTAILPGASGEDLDQFERRYGVVLPPLVRAYFAAAGGTGEEYAYDEKFCCFFPIGRVRPLAEEFPETCTADRLAYPDCYLFCEYGVWCWAYAVRLTQYAAQPGPVFRVVCDKSPGPQVAASFAEFLEIYLADPEKVP